MVSFCPAGCLSRARGEIRRMLSEDADAFLVASHPYETEVLSGRLQTPHLAERCRDPSCMQSSCGGLGDRVDIYGEDLISDVSIEA